MTEEQGAAFLNSQTACALIKMEAMKVANLKCQLHQGPGVVIYNEADFMVLMDDFQLHYNDAMTIMGK